MGTRLRPKTRAPYPMGAANRTVSRGSLATALQSRGAAQGVNPGTSRLMASTVLSARLAPMSPLAASTLPVILSMRSLR